jgi:hypothetical protein
MCSDSCTSHRLWGTVLGKCVRSRYAPTGGDMTHLSRLIRMHFVVVGRGSWRTTSCGSGKRST